MNTGNVMNNLNARNFDLKRPTSAIGLFLCIMVIVAIAFAITIRVIPNAIPAQLLIQLHTTPQILDQLNVTYQYSLIACLILSGLIVDIVGPRTTLIIAVTFAIIGNHLFGSAESVDYMLYGRIFIGYSYPFILTSVLTLGTHWLPRRHFSLFVGLVFGTFLLVPTSEYSLLQGIMTLDVLKTGILIANIIGVIVILSIVLTAKIADLTRRRHTLAGLIRPLRYYKLWLITLVSMLGWMVNTFLLHDGPYWLMYKFKYSMMPAVEVINTSFIFFSIGAVLMGLFSDYFQSKRYLITLGYSLGAIVFGILEFVPHLPLNFVPPLLFAGAFFISSSIVCYTKANDYCIIGNSGITVGFVLTATTIGSSLFASFTGRIIQHNITNAATWDWMLTLIPSLLLVGAVISFLLKPTHISSDSNLLLVERV
jgi:MFS family permease